MRSCVEPPRWAVPVILVAAALFSAQAVAWCGVADSAQVQYDRGAVLQKQGKHAEAIAEWQNLLTQYQQGTPADPQLATLRAAATLGIGEARRQSDQLDAAKATFTQLLSDYPQCRASCVDATIGIAKVCRKTGDTLKSIEMYTKVLSDYPEKLSRCDFAMARLGEMPIPADLQAKVDSAIAIYEKAKKEDDDITAVRKKAYDDAAAGKVEEAKAALAAQLSDPAVQASHSRLRMLALAMVAVRDVDNARIAFGKHIALAEQEYLPAAYLEARVIADYCLGDTEKLLTESQNALQLYPEGDIPPMLTIMYRRALTLDNLHRTEEAIAAYSAMVSRFSAVTDPDAREMMAHAMLRTGIYFMLKKETDEAKKWFQRAIDEYPGTLSAPTAAKNLRALAAKTDSDNTPLTGGPNR